jgi:fructose transport system substrate-binding protein
MQAIKLRIAVAAATLFSSLSPQLALAEQQPLVGLITKTNTNPFFVKMKEGAQAKASELGVTLQTFAGKFDGDNDSQVAAIEQLVAAGAKGILLVPSDSKAIVPAVKRARDAGIVVITLDTSLEPPQVADANIGTDNYKAGELIGQWAKGVLGDKAHDAKIATLDGAISKPSVDVLRHNGFLAGFGIQIKNPKTYAESDSPQIVGSDVTAGSEEGGRVAMEKILQKGDVNLVYAINEPAAYGGYLALKAAGKDKGVTIVAVDGGCNGVKFMKEGIIGGDSQQYPLLMAADGVQQVVDFIKVGKKPTSIDSGEKLITDHPVSGVISLTTDEAARLCWG